MTQGLHLSNKHLSQWLQRTLLGLLWFLWNSFSVLLLAVLHYEIEVAMFGMISEHNMNMTQYVNKKLNRNTNTLNTCTDIYTNTKWTLIWTLINLA